MADKVLDSWEDMIDENEVSLHELKSFFSSNVYFITGFGEKV